MLPCRRCAVHPRDHGFGAAFGGSARVADSTAGRPLCPARACPRMGRLVGAEAQLAAAPRLFVITPAPLAWLAGRGSAWATSNADGDALELPVYVARDEVQRRVEANEGDLVAALGRLGETAVI